MTVQRSTQQQASETDERSGPARRRRGTRSMLATAGVTTLAAVAVAGVAGASSPGSSTTSSGGSPAPRTSAPHAGAGHPFLGRWLHQLVHGQFEVRTKDGSLQTFDVDRGVLQSASATTIVLSPAGTSTSTVSATITSQTHFRGLPESKLQQGDRVFVVSQGGNAVVVGARAPKSSSPSGTSSPSGS